MNNPATKFLEWKGSKGVFQYYDKEEEENIEVPLPIEFAVVHQGTGIVGYHESSKSGIFSNEIVKMKEPLDVKTHSGESIATGKYKNIKDDIKKQGGRFCKFVYAVMNEELVCLKLSGSALSWFDDSKEIQLDESIVKVENTLTKEFTTKDGEKREYKVPVFEYSRNFTKEEFIKKSETEFEMREYLEEYRKPKEDNQADILEYKPKTQIDEIPF